MPQPLSIIAFSGGFDRVHYALVMASAAAATDRKTTVFFTGRAVRALVGENGWLSLDAADDGRRPLDRNRALQDRGVARFEELLEACVALGVRFIVCEMGLRALGLPAGATLRSDVPTTVAGVVTFLAEAEGGAIVHV